MMHDHRPLGNLGRIPADQPPRPAIQPRGMQAGVDVVGACLIERIRPERAKRQPIGAAAFGAGAVPGGTSGCFVQEKQFSIATGLHQRASAALEIGNAGNPAPQRMAAHNAPGGIMQATAIAHPTAALRHGVNVAQGIDPVLMHAVTAP